ncbi:MAG: response regulator transcription factor [Clostridiales bacterium]|jgi:DNA-binding response OmpR family regulator|nr:response regulator transcription factor [Clostridiales bacterium]
MYRIFIVEDDEIISSEVKKSLEAWGFSAHTVSDFREVMRDFAEFDPQLVLMDISLPFFNGYHWCSEIRKISKVPILFLSSSADNMNIVMAVNMGGDDFVAKPFDIQVLLAKIQALLRRTYDFSGETSVLAAHGAILDKNDTTLLFGGEKIALTKNEYRILEILMSEKGKVISRDAIMNRLWETDSFIDDNTLTVNITRLRKKLEEHSLNDFITTKKGMGYIIPD